ncbi:MAG: hypothetical protein KAJ19_24835 [Gammaproteobacteria bacterium]|nr:hypothetical protein [Gammaproteobacteria bacterium]
MQPIESLQPNIFYQVTEEEKQQRDAIEKGFLDNRVSKNLAKEGGYVTELGKLVKNRVSDYSKRFYDKLFRGRVQEEEAKEYNKLLAQKGTIIHKYLEIIGEALFAGKTVDMQTVKARVIKELKDKSDQANEDFWDKENPFFSLTGKQFGELREGLSKLIKQVRAKQNKIDPKGEVKFFPELVIYDQYGDLGGTIDLAVLYSNGSVGIYDYKTINFDETKTLPLYKEDAYNVQIGQYKRVLKDAYGITNFGETRIIPIDSQMTKTGLGFADLVMGSTDINNNERPYLDQIPVAKELTDDAALNRSLEKLFVLYDQLREKLSNDHRNEMLQLQVARVRKGIADLQLKSDVSFIFGEIKRLYDDFQERENLPDDHKFALNNIYLGEVEQYIIAYSKFGINAMPTAKKADDKESIARLQRVAHMLEQLEDRVNQKQIENNNRGENFKVEGSAPAEGFMGKLFKRLSRFNRPVFKKLSKMVHEVADKVRKDVDELNAKINEKTEELDKWAQARGWNLQKAFNRIINPKTGNLTSKFKSTYVEEQRAAAADKNKQWFVDNTQVKIEDGQLQYTGESLERFNRIKAEQFAYLDRALNEEDAIREKLKWAKKYDIAAEPFALFYKGNYFIKAQEKAENYSEDYNFMLQKGNEALKDYYDMYVEVNDMLSELTGKRIDYNFVAEIHTDLIDKLGENGLQGMRGIWDSLKRGIELHEHDLSRGKIDLVTGKPIGGIPLFYTGKLTGRVDNAERKRIEAEVAEEFTKGTVAYDTELENRMKKAEYYAGTKSKSRDLSRSLSLFGDAAFSYKHLSDTEASARSLLSIMKSQGQETELVDASGKKMINNITRKAAVMLGVPISEVDAMEKFINLYWYGQTTQGQDFAFTVGGKKYSSLKFYQAILGFTSASALAVKPVLAAGNAIGIKANYYMTGWEGRYYTREDIRKTHRMAVSGDVMYKAAISYFEPFTHDLSFRKANNMSVSKIAKTLTFENLFILHRLGDEHIDRNITVSMMQRFGIDKNGDVVHLRKLEGVEGADTRSILERSSIKDDKFVVEGLTEAQYIRFREMIQTAATGVKGNMSQEDKNLIGTGLMGQALMQFRNWMPGLIEKRFKGLEYDDLFDDYDVGRFRVFFGELTAKGTLPKLGAFTKALGEMVMMNVYSKGGEKTADNPRGRNINMEVTKRFYDKYREANPDTSLTMEEFVELRVAKLQGMAKELQIFLSFSLIVFAGKAMLPDEDEEALTKVSRLMAQNSFRVTQRGLLELSFFFDPESATTILKTPLPSLRFFVNLQKTLTNTVDETRDVIFGEDATREKTPRWYFLSKTIPVVSAGVDFFDAFDTYNKERGY